MKFLILILFSSTLLFTQSNSECLDCHVDKGLNNKQNITLFVNEDSFNSSIHSDLECIDCHVDFDSEDIPHREGENISKVDCSECHEVDDFLISIHGVKDVQCFECHTKHQIQEVSTLQESEQVLCTTCHTQEQRSFSRSIHFKEFQNGNKKLTCTGCHGNSAHSIDETNFSEDKLHSVCSECHKETVDNYEKSLHGLALSKNKYLAPNCITCHGQHNIKSNSDVNSKTYKMNVPGLCGKCHKNGTKVSELRNIDKKNILENYSLSIHGDGLFKRGLIVTAVCTDCHASHNILPHQDPKSSINRTNIAGTCAKCHAQIEAVHIKVIEGELWEKEPHKIPACIDCHQPHEVRRVFYEDKYTDEYCMKCHSDEKLKMWKNGKEISLHMDYSKFKNSAHKENSCIKCHTNVNVSNSPICIESGPVDCSSCHAQEVADYNLSFHGKLFAKNNDKAPYCSDCHSNHETKLKSDPTSKTFRQNIPELCASCHREGNKAAERYTGNQHKIIDSYTMSIHGKGLMESGLTVTAICVDCHTSHKELPASDSLSSVNPKNIAKTCSNCHYGIFEKFQKSVHSPEVTKTEKKLPTCYDCHKSHSIERVERSDFRQGIIDQCGVCHEEVTKTYFDTFHGKVSRLGDARAAKCYDCHGSHNILRSDDPNSTLSRTNVVETCKKCHENSNKKFVGYLSHATHHDKDKYPYLFYTFWAMTILLIGTFTFFGLHTIFWFPRALKEKKRLNAIHNKQIKKDN